MENYNISETNFPVLKNIGLEFIELEKKFKQQNMRFEEYNRFIEILIQIDIITKEELEGKIKYLSNGVFDIYSFFHAFGCVKKEDLTTFQTIYEYIDSLVMPSLLRILFKWKEQYDKR